MDSRLPHTCCFPLVESFLFTKHLQRCGSWSLGGRTLWALAGVRTSCTTAEPARCAAGSLLSRNPQPLRACSVQLFHALPKNVGFISNSHPCGQHSHAGNLTWCWYPEVRLYRQSSFICHPLPAFNKDLWKTWGSHSGLQSVCFGDCKGKRGNLMSKHPLMKFCSTFSWYAGIPKSPLSGAPSLERISCLYHQKNASSRNLTDSYLPQGGEKKPKSLTPSCYHPTAWFFSEVSLLPFHRAISPTIYTIPHLPWGLTAFEPSPDNL